MQQTQFNALFSYLWNIANDVLVDRFEATEYRNIIMPMLTLRRIDVLLEPTKEAVLKQKEMLDKQGLTNIEPFLTNITKLPFYNTSQFTMKLLKSETNSARLKKNFIEYLNGFNADVQDIIEKFKLRQYVDSMTAVDCLGSVIEKFTSDKINLSTKPVVDDDGNVILPALDNHAMGTLFEQLLRKFNESYAVTSAGRHFTPRDYVAMLAELAIMPVADKLQNSTYTIYDGACGTGGILTEAQKRIQQIADEKGKKISTLIFGQELMPETYATCKADIMMTGNQKSFKYTRGGNPREIIAFGSTISQDGQPGEKYDFCISNPPFGTAWKEDLKRWGNGTEIKKDEIVDPRFVIKYDDNPDFRFVPDIGDPQMLFLANNISRMKEDTPLGTRIVEIHNGSSLFTGDAGGGESNLRRYIIENDLLEAIVAMPLNNFYNTGIGTYIWIVTNRKEERRKGKVQLIDATEIKTPLRKNLGEKNCETNDKDRAQILKLFMDFEENEQSKIFDNREFGYWRIVVQRPLRLCVNTEADLSQCAWKANELELAKEGIEKALKKQAPLDDWDAFAEATELKKTLLKKLRPIITYKSPMAKPVAGEADPDLKDEEQVPLLYDGGIQAFMKNEVLPYAPDAYVAEDKTVIGYELSFTKYFYKPVELHSIDEIAADIRSIESDCDGLLDLILNKQAKIAQAVTRGINPNAPLKDSGIKWIGMVPEHWEVKRLAMAFSENKKRNTEYEFDHAMKFNYGTLVPKNEIGDVSDLKETYLDYTILEKNDIAINCLNLNYDFVSQRVAIAKERGILTSSYLIISPRKGVNADYFHFLFKAMDNKKLFHGMGTGIRLTLSYKELKKQLIPIPPLSEQQAIVAYINEQTAKIDQMIAGIQQQIENLKEYKQSLISDVVTGKICVNE